ncbi:patatin-like phospholipase family protein [Williamsia sp. CHRR-6]|uniref:patatin-like phospholipase family protein n=1 Tax=Williamsia sp. CHRR-6 TaxID=2835871 RepID=UPI001BD97392|nr:patatin-like phospholipase family protein [Williamsia sp. CHRR-6]MBT0566640.1 patatin-like phospholipase family protein [Williamsia sp. CHRR-6]
MTTKVALALGSGGARGYAHIGVLQVLAEHDYEVVAVAGSSMGALVGGLYAADRLDEWTEWATGLSQFDVFKLLDISLSAPGVIHADKIIDRVRDMLGETLIENLRIPFTAVATDLNSGRPMWFQRGEVDEAIRASIAIPGVITPHVLDGRVYIDGGLLQPLPIAPLAAAGAEVIIAVDVGADTGGSDDAHEDGSDDGAPRESTWDAMMRIAGESSVVRGMVNLFSPHPKGAQETQPEVPDDTERTAVVVEKNGAGTRGAASVAAAAVGKLSAFSVMDRSIDIMQEALVRHQLASFPPDVLIQIPRNSLNSMDFHRAQEMIDLGRALAEQAFDDYAGRSVPHLQRVRTRTSPTP